MMGDNAAWVSSETSTTLFSAAGVRFKIATPKPGATEMIYATLRLFPFGNKTVGGRVTELSVELGCSRGALFDGRAGSASTPLTAVPSLGVTRSSCRRKP